ISLRHSTSPLFPYTTLFRSKNFICGEGGALVVNDPADIDRAHVLFDKGTNRRAFLHGQVDKYSWQDVGSSFGLGEVLAAYLLGRSEEHTSELQSRENLVCRL